MALKLFNRERAILEFNRRVIEQIRDESIPLLERLRFLCIVSFIMDEFFEIRIPSYFDSFTEIRDSKKLVMDETSQAIFETAHELVHIQYKLYNEMLKPALRKEGIFIYSYSERTADMHKWVENLFRREIQPHLLPINLDPSHPFPKVANKSLNFIVEQSGADVFGRHNTISIIRVPRFLPRVYKMPSSVMNEGHGFVLISSVIRAHLKDLFPDQKVTRFSQFRVTRDSELWLDEEEAKNLRKALHDTLSTRQFGDAVRLEVSNSCPEELIDILLHETHLNEQALYRVKGPVNLVRLSNVIDLHRDPNLLYPPVKQAWPAELDEKRSILSQIAERDIMLHHPFETFDPVLEFLDEAVRDPNVLSIYQTIYRTGIESHMMDMLMEAVRRGKEVIVVLELKARFDEETNINWAEQLERVGVQVIYGIVELKTHAKMLLVTRREGRKLNRYVHLSTGNYNQKTVKMYTDIGFLTSDPRITKDVEELFRLLASQQKLPRMRSLLVAPFTLYSKMISLTRKAAQAVRNGKKAKIIIKINALTDEKLIWPLIRAGKAGVQIDLIVRGACMLPPQIPKQTENIRVRSIIGRYLEHSRIFYFNIDGEENLWLSSADWMRRNMHRRIEIAWPIYDSELRRRIIEEGLENYLKECKGVWHQCPDGSYVKSKSTAPSPQERLEALYQVHE